MSSFLCDQCTFGICTCCHSHRGQHWVIIHLYSFLPLSSSSPLLRLFPFFCFLSVPSSSSFFVFPVSLSLFPPLLSFLLQLPEKALTPFSEIALTSLLQLLKKEVSEHSRHLQQYFQAFLNYANKGPFEVCHHTYLFIPFVSCVLYIVSFYMSHTRSVSIALVNN